MNERPRAMSQTRVVFERLRTAIVDGRLLPGSKLNIAALAEEIEVSAGAVREGLAMLEAEALVVSEPARGYRVSPVSAVELQDLVNARIEIEKLCLVEAIRHGDLAWEGGVVAASHRLSRIAERDADLPDRVNPEWAASHAEFHRALVAGCPNQWLLRMHEMLYQQSERYRQLSVPLAKLKRDVKAEHQALVDAVLNKDIRVAQELIEKHLGLTAQMLLNSPYLALSPAETQAQSPNG
ncbi:MAG: FCD domain-containing protein [Pseudomonadota bacterium]